MADSVSAAKAKLDSSYLSGYNNSQNSFELKKMLVVYLVGLTIGLKLRSGLLPTVCIFADATRFS